MLAQPKNSELFQLAAAGKYAEIADMRYDDIARFHEQQRFKAIARIKNVVLIKDPAPQDDPGKLVCPERFSAEIAALTRISMTMSHTNAYNQWRENCRNLLFTRLLENNNFMRFLPQWESGDLSIKKGIHTIREREHTKAANDTFKPIFSSTKVKYFTKPRRQDPIPERRTITNGTFTGNIKTNKRTIHINDHLDSKFKSASTSLGNGQHEKLHDLGLQIGYLYGKGDIQNLSNQAQDAKIWYYLRSEKASIPYRIGEEAYRSQFHEVAAFDEGDKMQEMIKQILNGNLTPPAPLCNPGFR